MSEPLPHTHISRDELEALQLKAGQPGGKGLSIQTFTELTREILRLREAINKHKYATTKAQPLFHSDGSRAYIDALQEISQELWNEVKNQ